MFYVYSYLRKFCAWSSSPWFYKMATLQSVPWLSWTRFRRTVRQESFLKEAQFLTVSSVFFLLSSSHLFRCTAPQSYRWKSLTHRITVSYRCTQLGHASFPLLTSHRGESNISRWLLECSLAIIKMCVVHTCWLIVCFLFYFTRKFHVKKKKKKSEPTFYTWTLVFFCHQVWWTGTHFQRTYRIPYLISCSIQCNCLYKDCEGCTGCE